jgi:nuclear pore complex protein Nup160
LITGVPDPKKHADFRSGGYLDATERNLLNAGLPEYYSHIVALYEKEKIYSYVIDFARLALQFIRPGEAHIEQSQLRTEMHSRLFNAAIQTSRYDLAHSTLTLFTDSALQHSCLRTLVTKMCEASRASELIALPFLGLQDAVDELLAQKCQSIVDVTMGVPYHKILYAWRIKHHDFRGAATISLERLQRLQQSSEGDRALRDDRLETPVTQQYVALINALSCVDPKQAWILSEELPKKGPPGVKVVPPKRKVVTLEEVRRLYQEELDRIAAIENNQFPFDGGEDMEVDVL